MTAPTSGVMTSTSRRARRALPRLLREVASAHGVEQRRRRLGRASLGPESHRSVTVTVADAGDKETKSGRRRVREVRDEALYSRWCKGQYCPPGAVRPQQRGAAHVATRFAARRSRVASARERRRARHAAHRHAGSGGSLSSPGSPSTSPV